MAECMETMIERRRGLRSLSGLLVSSLTWSAALSGPAPDRRRRCDWLTDGRCRQEREGSVLIADTERRWEIPAHKGPVLIGPRGELPVDRLTNPTRLREFCNVRIVDEAADYEGRPALVVEAECLDDVSVEDRLLTLDAEFGVILIDLDLMTGRELRLTKVRFNEDLDPDLFIYRPESWRTLVHAQPC